MYTKKDVKEKTLLLIFLLLVLFFTRLYALFSVGALFYSFEGIWRGWMAKELLDGAGWGSVFHNPYFPAGGGSAVTGYLAALFFSIFGDSFLSLVLVPIVFSLLILTAFYIFLARYFSRSTAIVFSFLFIFPPLHFFTFSLAALGNHFESILFSILGLFCFFEIFFNGAHYKTYLEKSPDSNIKKLYLLFIVFGLISGLGIYFFYGYLIMLFTLVLFWFFFDKRFFLKRYFYLFLLGLIIGLLPWLIYNITHNFQGLNIHGLTFFEVMFTKSIPQIFQTFGYILIKVLPRNLGGNLYRTIVFSFIFIAFLNVNSFRQIFKNLFSPQANYLHNIKELFFIGYVLVFISTWSVLYMPIGDAGDFLAGIGTRLIPSYPFLFVLVAFCFNRFLAIKKKFLGMVFSSVLIIWIVNIGFSNYSFVNSESTIKINPLKTKGYSVRLAYVHGEKRIASFLDWDMRTLAMAMSGDNMLWKFFSAAIQYDYYPYIDTRLPQEWANDPEFDEDIKPYYYLMVGLNAGDLLEDYDILNLKNLISQKILNKYRHFIYEGIAVSLMNRNSKELIENIDFIEMVPEKYRHYFLLELIEVIKNHFDAETSKDKLQYIREKFPFILKDYLSGDLKERHKRIEDFFREYNIFSEREIRKNIERVITSNLMEKDFSYEGLGYGLGYLTFGYIHKFTGFIESLLDDEKLPHFYYGYSLSLKERYGEDSDIITELINHNVPERFKKMCYKVELNQHYLEIRK